jgi:hypothetical protein
MGLREMSAEMLFARAGMGYVGAWDLYGGVQLSLDHIRRRSGEVHGEIVVEAGTIPTARGKLHRAAFNVSSTTSRDRLAKTLDARAPGTQGIPWKHLIEEFCTAVLEAERTGAPILEVGDLPAQTEEGYLVDPLLPRNKTTIVFAAGGTGKSYLACLVSVAVASGTGVLGWRVHRGDVLYLDWETDAYEVDRRIKRVSAGLGLPEVPRIAYRACAGPLDDMAEPLSSYIAERGIKLVIVDSVGMATGSSREGPAEESAIRLFSAIRHLGATVLAIDHVTGEDVKSGRAVEKPYGSIYKVNLARSVYELKGTPVDGQDAHMALFHRKVNVGSLQPPLGIKVVHEADAVRFSREDIGDPGLVTGLSHGTRITKLLRGGSASVSDIAEELDISEGIVRVTLNRGKGKQFVKLTDGSWGLAATP